MSGAGGRMTRRSFVAAAGAGGAALLTPSFARAGLGLGWGDSVVLRWNDAALQGVRESRLGPPMVARALAIVHTCAYDAWAAYDRVAVGTRLGDALRRPPWERTQAAKNEAISYAAYLAAVDLFPGSTTSVFDPLMASLGYDASESSSAAAEVGRTAARAVLEFRHRDGSNQLGGYADTTGYVPVNAPMSLLAPFDRTSVVDPSSWQPLHYVDLTRAAVTPGYVAPHWANVTPFALSLGSQLRSQTPPARYGSDRFVAQAQALVELSAGLTDEQKVIAEYWADGPRSELPPGHWDLFAHYVSRRDHHGANERGVDLDVKLFFALTNAIFDAGICAWDNKRAFNSVRPITALRYVFEGRPVRAWGGPYAGTRSIDGAAWLPYQPSTFPTPPFPEYSSGHSNFSAAAAEILRLFTRRDVFGGSTTIAAGSSKVEPGAVPATDVTVAWPTFSVAADQAGISRRYGGIHFEQGDLDARTSGRQAAATAWAKARTYFNGTV